MSMRARCDALLRELGVDRGATLIADVKALAASVDTPFNGLASTLAALEADCFDAGGPAAPPAAPAPAAPPVKPEAAEASDSEVEFVGSQTEAERTAAARERAEREHDVVDLGDDDAAPPAAPKTPGAKVPKKRPRDATPAKAPKTAKKARTPPRVPRIGGLARAKVTLTSRKPFGGGDGFRSGMRLESEDPRYPGVRVVVLFDRNGTTESTKNEFGGGAVWELSASIQKQSSFAGTEQLILKEDASFSLRRTADVSRCCEVCGESVISVDEPSYKTHCRECYIDKKRG